MRAHIYAFLCAGLGVLAFKLLQLPLPWLLGPIFACLIAALLGVPMRGVKVINEAMRSILGVAVGATFSLALLVSMGSMWSTLLLIPVMTTASDWLAFFISSASGGLILPPAIIPQCRAACRTC